MFPLKIRSVDQYIGGLDTIYGQKKSYANTRKERRALKTSSLWDWSIASARYQRTYHRRQA